MRPHQKEFIDLILDRGVLRFGEFTLKSGRASPYFFNAGLINDGESLRRLGSVASHDQETVVADAGIEHWRVIVKGQRSLAVSAVALTR